VVIYKTPEEFNSAVRNNKDFEWIQHELRSLPDARPDSSPIQTILRGQR